MERARSAVADMGSRSVWAASTDEAVEVVDSVHVLVTQLTAIQAACIHELEGRGYPAKQGSASTRVWLRDRLRISIHAAQRLVALGEILADRPALAAAVGSGEVGVEQATVIAGALSDLPADLGVAGSQALTADCEVALIGPRPCLGTGHVAGARRADPGPRRAGHRRRGAAQTTR